MKDSNGGKLATLTPKMEAYAQGIAQGIADGLNKSDAFDASRGSQL